MNPLLAAALEVQAVCRAQDWRFCFIGDIEGMAIRQAGRLDERLIWTELVPLLELKESLEDAGQLRAILDRARS